MTTIFYVAGSAVSSGAAVPAQWVMWRGRHAHGSSRFGATRPPGAPSALRGWRNQVFVRMGPQRNVWQRNRTEYRPVQITGTKSDGISTCANLSVARVAFSSGFACRWSSRRTVRGRNRTEYRPVQIFQLHKSIFHPTFPSARSRRQPARSLGRDPVGADALDAATPQATTRWSSRPSCVCNREAV